MRKTVLPLAVLLLVVTLGTPGAHSRSQVAGDAVDFIRFGGAVYLSSTYLAHDPTRELVAPALGPVIGQVLSNRGDPDDAIAYPNEPCYWAVRDGTAPALRPGDEIYAVHGYASSFRIAARHGGRIALYQVWCNDRAKVGADLFDIYRRVQRISLTNDLSESSGWAVIDDPHALTALVDMILSGPIVPQEMASTEPIGYQLVFTLVDGTTFRASVAPGELLWGLGVIALPPAFDEALDRAWASGEREAQAVPAA